MEKSDKKQWALCLYTGISFEWFIYHIGLSHKVVTCYVLINSYKLQFVSYFKFSTHLKEYSRLWSLSSLKRVWNCHSSFLFNKYGRTQNLHFRRFFLLCCFCKIAVLALTIAIRRRNCPCKIIRLFKAAIFKLWREWKSPILTTGHNKCERGCRKNRQQSEWNCPRFLRFLGQVRTRLNIHVEWLCSVDAHARQIYSEIWNFKHIVSFLMVYCSNSRYC